MRIGVLPSYRGSMTGSESYWIDDTGDWAKCARAWEEYAVKMILKMNEEKEQSQIQVFLFLRWGFWHEFKTLKHYLKIIHQNTWFANEIYLVIDRRTGKDTTDDPLKASLDTWFGEINKVSIDDILQTDVDESMAAPDERTLDKLKGLVSISLKRRAMLKKMLALKKIWEYKVHWIFDDLRHFLRDTGNPPSADTNSPDAIIIEGNWNSCKVDIHRDLSKLPGEKFLLICTTDVDANLAAYADDNNISIITFSGFCDVRYFLHLYYFLQSNIRLSQATDSSLSLPIAGIIPDGNEAVFSQYSSSGRKVNLVTSAFDPNDFDSYDLNPHASKILFDIFDGYRESTFVHPIINTNNLSTLLGRMPQALLVWTHFGHGNETGLQDSARFFRSAEAWLDSFRGKRKSLSLAFFFSCRSARIAEQFARSGVKITVGFENRVSMEAVFDLAKVIIPITLELKGENQEEILTTFKQRCSALGSDYLNSCEPRIFYSNNGAK